MTVFIRTLFFTLAAAVAMTASAFAQDVSDLTGHWDIEVTNNPDASFSGQATIPYATGKTIEAELITEDSCCRGQNYAKVRQTSQITVMDGQISVYSEITEYIIREEKLPGVTYSADDFDLEWLDENTLVGTLNGYTPVIWTRRLSGVV